MSNFAVNMNIYEGLRKYINLIDWILLDFSSKKEKPEKREIQKKLAVFFDKLSDKENMEMGVYLISVILKSALKGENVISMFQNLSKALLEGRINQVEINQLEKIAEILDEESVQAYSRIRGTR